MNMPLETAMAPTKTNPFLKMLPTVLFKSTFEIKKAVALLPMSGWLWAMPNTLRPMGME